MGRCEEDESASDSVAEVIGHFNSSSAAAKSIKPPWRGAGQSRRRSECGVAEVVVDIGRGSTRS